MDIHGREIDEAQYGALCALARVMQTRDPLALNHALKVADYAAGIADILGLDAARVGQIWQAGFLHDIGKIGMPDTILNKPSRLTEEEYDFIKIHAQLGGDLVRAVPSLQHLARFVGHHHERWDGTGYPLGLKGDEIALEARILALCDAVEAMSSDRPYRRSLPLADVIEEVERCSGRQFDPAVVDAFLTLVESDVACLVNSARRVPAAAVLDICVQRPSVR